MIILVRFHFAGILLLGYLSKFVKQYYCCLVLPYEDSGLLSRSLSQDVLKNGLGHSLSCNLQKFFCA